ncbi:MAG TPA: dihydrolipoamide acetyltransferase family protein [Bdellovibrionales bacterium]|nr:dihydrolipoamide acetyltransferase family protein [Bdellovibrionales bacterium]
MDIKLPEIGEGVTEGELVKWLVKPGDTVKVDQPIAEVMTDKATVEIPSPQNGKVVALKAEEGKNIQVGGVLLTLEASGAGAAPEKPAPAPQTAKPAPAPQAAKPASQAPAPQAYAGASGTNGQTRPQTEAARFAGASAGDVYPPAASSKVLATPSTRRLAREMNVDINNLKGSGLAGRVTREDVMGAGGGSAASAGGGMDYVPRQAPVMGYTGPTGAVEERVPMRGIRKKVAEKMQLSKQIIPHFTLMDEAEVTELVKVRTSVKEKMAAQGIKVTYLPFVMKALIATAREFPMVNASIDDAAQEIVYKQYFNIGFAADTPQGLVVPVIKNADRKSIAQISREIVELSEKARAGKLAPDDLKGATMTITNIGSVGGTYATPIINHPEVMIFGMYKISERPVFKNGELVAANVMNVTCTADHRLIDGAVAARFLTAVIARLENPGMLMMDLT